MSVKGTLESLSLEDILQAELSAQGDGRLILRNGAHYAAIQISSDGAYVIHPDLLEAETILQCLVERGVLDPAVMAATKRHHLSDVILLDSLVESGELPEHELMEILAAETEDTFLDLMLWQRGFFLFERGHIDPSERGLLGRISVDPAGVCTRARERIDERRAIGDQLGDNALLFVAQAGALAPLEGPEDLTHAVYARLNGQTVVHEIALQLRVGRFYVLRALARLSKLNLVRPATPEELVQQATIRSECGQDRIARALVLQWAEVHPDEEGPLRKLASLAAAANDKQAELEALCTLGHQQLQASNAQDALDTFTRAMRKAPADDVVLAGLRLAAEATGDNDSLVDGTLLISQTKLDEGLAEEALELLVPLLATYPDNIMLHLMRARALVMLEKRNELLEQAELVGQVLGRDGALSQVDKEAVEFFKEAIADVAPDRGDLLERFRALYDPKRARQRRTALATAMILLICSAGVYFWPASAGSLLEKAQAAADAGDRDRAGSLLAELTNRFPEAQEMHEATLLQNRLFPPHNTAPRAVTEARELSNKTKAAKEEVLAALAELPAESAQARIRTALAFRSEASTPKSKASALKLLSKPMSEAAHRLNKESVERAKLLAQTAGLHEEYRENTPALRDFLANADAQRDIGWIGELRGTTELLAELSRDTGSDLLGVRVRELLRSVSALEETAAFYDAHAGSCRLTLARLQIDEADRRCREDAPELMVSGEFDRADELYKNLHGLIEKCRQSETYQPLIENLERRQIPEFLQERQGQILDIRTQLAIAKKAEEQDDLERAVEVYGTLIKKYWLIRFESVFAFPLRIETVPPGATVRLNGDLIGHSPTIVRYPFGSKTQVQVEAPGWDPISVDLLTAAEEVPHSITLRLRPTPAWTCLQHSRGTAGAVRIGDDILRADRDGTVTRHAGRTGAVMWTASSSSLEGSRGRPALADNKLYVTRVDGKVIVLDPNTGRTLRSFTIPRPRGDVASVDGRAAVAMGTGDVIGFRGTNEIFRSSLGGTPTAGLVGAHGAFWAGLANGKISRIEPISGATREVTVAGKNVPVSALIATPEGLLATTAVGSLVALSRDGRITWRADDLGDLIGAPTQVGQYAAVATRAGSVALFSSSSGKPANPLDFGPGAWHGLLSSGDVLFGSRKDGSAWAYDMKARKLILDGPQKLKQHVIPSLIGPDHLMLGLEDGRIGVVPLPKLPAVPATENATQR